MCIIAERTTHTLARSHFARIFFRQLLFSSCCNCIANTGIRQKARTTNAIRTTNTYTQCEEHVDKQKKEEEKMMTAPTVSYWVTRFGQVCTWMPSRAIITIHCTATRLRDSQPAAWMRQTNEFSEEVPTTATWVRRGRNCGKEKAKKESG